MKTFLTIYAALCIIGILFLVAVIVVESFVAKLTKDSKFKTWWRTHLVGDIDYEK